MRIIIDSDGSTHKCIVTHCSNSASYPNITYNGIYNIKDVDGLNKAMAINVMKSIIKDNE